VKAQLYDAWELCIADDGSKSPETRAMLERYAAQDPRIKVVFREINGHISAASNSALEVATGEWIALLDHDDELSVPAVLAVLARDARDARIARAEQVGERTAGSLRFRLPQGGDRGVEVVAQFAQDARHGRRVGPENLHPQPRVARGDARHIAHALAREVDGGVARPPQPRRHGARDELRHVADERDGAIVLLDAELDRHGADVENEVFDRSRRAVADAVVARENPRPPHEEVGARRDGPAALAPRHGVRAEVAADVGAEGAQLGEHVAQILVIHPADPLQPRHVSAGQQVKIVQERRHGRVAAIALDLLALGAFMTLKAMQDPWIIVIAVGGVAATFLLEWLYLSRWRKHDPGPGPLPDEARSQAGRSDEPD